MLQPMHISEIFTNKAGVLAVDKPSGVSSHTVISWARKVFGVKRIGHTGTLDPLASGLLLLLVSRAYTKMQEQYLKQDKSYDVTVRLGVVSDTYDRMGTITTLQNARTLDSISDDEITSALSSFLGVQMQTVPAFSAVKRKGKKLYELAREEDLDLLTLPEREVLMHAFTQVSVVRSGSNVHVTFGVRCSSGTYVRSLAHDLGQQLGCGAIISELRRTGIGTISVADASICPVIPARFYLH